CIRINRRVERMPDDAADHCRQPASGRGGGTTSCTVRDELPGCYGTSPVKRTSAADPSVSRDVSTRVHHRRRRLQPARHVSRDLSRGRQRLLRRGGAQRNPVINGRTNAMKSFLSQMVAAMAVAVLAACGSTGGGMMGGGPPPDPEIRSGVIEQI